MALNPIEYRAAETLGVRYPERVIEVLAVPYERPTDRVIHDGHQIVEVFSRGAFHGLKRTNVKVFRDHEMRAAIGRAIQFYPDDDDGLRADLRISDTLLGDESLELARDGVLDVSIGFAPKEGGVRMSADGRQRRINSAYLDHIALVTVPAYEEARVLAVRSADELEGHTEPVSATPNLDRMLAMLAEAGIQLDR